MSDDKLHQIMQDIDRDMAGIMPSLVARMKKRVHLAYLYGVEDARELARNTRTLEQSQMSLNLTD